MRTLRRQVDTLQTEIEPRVHYQQLLHAQNTQLRDKAIAIQQSDQQNCAQARSRCDELQDRLTEFRQSHTRLRDEISRRRRGAEELEKAGAEEERLRAALGVALARQQELTAVLERRRTHNAELEREQDRLRGVERSADEQARRIESLVVLKDQQAMADQLWQRGSRGLGRAFALLLLAIRRDRALRAITAKCAAREGRALLRVILSRWRLNHRQRRFARDALVTRQRELMGEVVVRWRLFVAMEVRFRRKRARRLISSVWRAWRAGILAAQRERASSQLLESHLESKILRTVLRVWRNDVYSFSLSPREAEEKTAVAHSHYARAMLTRWQRHAVDQAADFKARLAAHAELRDARCVRVAHAAWRDLTRTSRFRRRVDLGRSVRALASRAASRRLCRERTDRARRAGAMRALERWRQAARATARLRLVNVDPRMRAMQRTVHVWRRRCSLAVRWRSQLARAARHRVVRLLSVHYQAWLETVPKARNPSNSRVQGDGTDLLNLLRDNEDPADVRRCTRHTLHRAMNRFRGLLAARRRRRACQRSAAVIERCRRNQLLATTLAAWVALHARRRRARARGQYVSRKRSQAATRRTLTRWSTGWLRAMRTRQHTVDKDTSSVRDQLDAVYQRLKELDAQRAKLTSQHESLVSQVQRMKTAGLERERERTRLKQLLDEEARNEACARETLRIRDQEAAALKREASFLSAIDEEFQREKVRMSEVLEQQRREMAEHAKALQLEQANLQREVSSAQAEAMEAQQSVETTKKRDEAALGEANALLRKYETLLEERHQASAALEHERETMCGQLRVLQQKMASVCEESAAATVAESKRSREHEAKYSLLRVRLAQVEARESEALQILHEQNQGTQGGKMSVTEGSSDETPPPKAALEERALFSPSCREALGRLARAKRRVGIDDSKRGRR